MVSGIRWAAPDHASLLSAAVDVTTADGLVYVGKLLSTPDAPGHPPLLRHLTQGVVDVDYPASGGYVLHLYHFHHPWTHRGYAGSCVSGAQVTEDLFGDALDLWRANRRAEAAYELGRACHPLADGFVPYHAAGVAGCGHAGYEDWLTRDQRWREWLPAAGGRYQWQAIYQPGDGRAPHALDWRSPAHWVDLATHESWPWFRDRLNGCAGGLWGSRPDIRAFFPAAASVLVPATIRYLAGFLHLFFTLAGASPEAAG